MQLTPEQKRAFVEHGYVHVPQAVSRDLVNAALRAINHSLGEGVPAETIQTFRAQSYCPELRREPVITDLYNKSHAATLAESLIGVGKVKPVTGGQIALRFPSLQQAPPPPGPHLDGMYSPTNGVPQGTIASFTMLLGVMLSDVSDDFAGNLTVWPGTHGIYESYFREHGPESLLSCMPPVDLPQPVQLTGKAGDIVLCHYQLAHGVALNVSPHVRYAIYFRLHHVEHAAQWKEAMTDIWLEWDGVRDLAS
jgi:ectoine hydroxylase-related dioxygenase (phytanoyl-CoA dioxygenase family)